VPSSTYNIFALPAISAASRSEAKVPLTAAPNIGEHCGPNVVKTHSASALETTAGKYLWDPYKWVPQLVELSSCPAPPGLDSAQAISISYHPRAVEIVDVYPVYLGRFSESLLPTLQLKWGQAGRSCVQLAKTK